VIPRELQRNECEIDRFLPCAAKKISGISAFGYAGVPANPMMGATVGLSGVLLPMRSPPHSSLMPTKETEQASVQMQLNSFDESTWIMA
jgi:hypothetical protein